MFITTHVVYHKHSHSHTLTVLSVFFNLQFQDAVRDDCTRRDLHGNIAVYLNAVAVLHTHLGAHIYTHI